MKLKAWMLCCNILLQKGTLMTRQESRTWPCTTFSDLCSQLTTNKILRSFNSHEAPFRFSRKLYQTIPTASCVKRVCWSGCVSIYLTLCRCVALFKFMTQVKNRSMLFTHKGKGKHYSAKQRTQQQRHYC